MGNLLVIGARPGSIGDAVAELAAAMGHWNEVVIGGITKEHDILIDATAPDTWDKLNKFDDIVCTVGVNRPSVVGNVKFASDMGHMFTVNAMGPLLMMEQWCFDLQEKRRNLSSTTPWRSMCVVSSNSAHIARSQSVGYCASKAALSMGVRCLARQMANTRQPVSLFGVEPGWIDDTPMSEAVARLLGTDDPALLHRIPGERSMTRYELANYIVKLMIGDTRTLNGCMFRLDAGEQ